MNFLGKKNYSITENVLKKIIIDFKSEIKQYKDQIKKLEEIDYKYNKKVIDVDTLLDVINLFNQPQKISNNNENIIICYNGNPYTTIQLMLLGIQNSSMVNLVIDDLCFGINKLLVTLFNDVLKDYGLSEIISLNNFENSNNLNELKDIDKVYFLGTKNIFSVCKNIIKTNFEFIPYDSINIFCDKEKYSNVIDKTLEYCFENNIEAEVNDIMYLDSIINNKNNIAYCNLLLTDDKDCISKFKYKLNNTRYYINENPFKDKYEIVPNFLN